MDEIVKVDVLFRYDTTKDFKGDIFAVFPHEVADHFGRNYDKYLADYKKLTGLK